MTITVTDYSKSTPCTDTSGAAKSRWLQHYRSVSWDKMGRQRRPSDDRCSALGHRRGISRKVSCLFTFLGKAQLFVYFAGFDDNGSGMAALLEIARALGASQCQYDNSIILAALDLEEVGTHGAIAFIHDFLITRILRPFGYPDIRVGIAIFRPINHNSQFPF